MALTDFDKYRLTLMFTLKKCRINKKNCFCAFISQKKGIDAQCLVTKIEAVGE